MNKLPFETRVQIVNLLVEGNSLRAISRITDTSINTVTKLLVDVGRACLEYHNTTVKNINSKRIQLDEIWSFVYAKNKNVPDGMDQAGDVWTWVGIDADTKLVVSWMVGNRDSETAIIFIDDIADRIAGEVQITTDGYKAYINPIKNSFGPTIDYAMLRKIYGGFDPAKHTDHRYSPDACTSAEKIVISGNPKPEHISTSYVERQNLTMRMHMRRFTRLTNGFSKKFENHCLAVALHFMYYNFCKIHKTLRVTPAMEAGITKDLWSVADLVRLI